MSAKFKITNTPAIRRMPTYLHRLDLMLDINEEFVSTTKLAQELNIDPIIVKKDLELTDIKGRPGIGYRTRDLVQSIRRFLHWDQICPATLIGVGALGSAILGYQEFIEYGMVVRSVFDSDPNKIGTQIHGHLIQDSALIEEVLGESPVQIAILTVPHQVAQPLADRLCALGISAIWNFANTALFVPPQVIVQREVLAGGYAVLSRKIIECPNGSESPNSL